MKKKKNMSIISLSFTGIGTELNRRLCEKLKKNFHLERGANACTGYAPEKYAGEGILPLPADKAALIGSGWGKSAYVFIGAAGIAVRYIGHVGGAAALADEVADMIGAVPVHTTATDVQGKFAVDVFAKKNGLVITDREAVKKISAGLLNGEKAALYIEDPFVNVTGTLPDEIVLCESFKKAEQYSYQIIITGSLEQYVKGRESEVKEPEQEGCSLLLLPRNIAAGIGCRKGIEESVLENGFLGILAENGMDIRQVKSIASIDLKKNEPALLHLCEKYRIPFETYTAEELRSVSDVTTASEFVKKITGVDNVCERAARLSCTAGSMIQGKRIREGMTAALVKCPMEIAF